MTAAYSQTSYSPDRLFGDPPPKLSRKITLLTGENLARGAVLGKITGGAGATDDDGVADAGNTGNGTIGTVSAVAGAQPGVYTITIVEPGANLGTFTVEDPNGVEIGTGVVATQFSNQVQFTIADGSTDFIAGDRFTITVTAVATEKYKLSASASADGSETPDAVLAEATDASGGDKETMAYFDGAFNEDRVVLGAGHTAASIREGLRNKGIHLVKPLSA
ncbi:hypothetical protein LCGC14_1462710 [marine sediment metagenome]|uniref:Head decoration protein n=1 Tax=marine sediment metagenome TaxID=412755 RepID=A0A0F9JF87_9ZZZZ